MTTVYKINDDTVSKKTFDEYIDATLVLSMVHKIDKEKFDMLTIEARKKWWEAYRDEESTSDQLQYVIPNYKMLRFHLEVSELEDEVCRLTDKLVEYSANLKASENQNHYLQLCHQYRDRLLKLELIAMTIFKGLEKGVSTVQGSFPHNDLKFYFSTSKPYEK